MRTITICALLSLGLLSACSRKPADPPAGATTPAPNAVGQPVASHATTNAEGTATGKVVETMNAANYTYVRVKTASGDIWAATTTFKVAVGDEVIVPLENPMEQFHSQSLNRDFPLVYFATSIGVAGAGAAAGPEPPAPSAAAVQVTEPIAPAPGGTSIATLWANRKTLVGKTVTVRGKVVKFNGAILGLNWTHIQDGSGSAKDGTNDITITSEAGAKLGDVVTVTGTVVIDKDFGAGYAYKVLLQNASITVK